MQDPSAPAVDTDTAKPKPAPPVPASAPEAPKPEPEAPAKPTPQPSPAVPPGSIVLQNTIRVNDTGFNVCFLRSDGKVKVSIICETRTNKKLPPHCMLACIRDGKIVKTTDPASAPPPHAIPYKVSRQTLVFNKDDLTVSPTSPASAIAVSALLEKTKAKTVAEHSEQYKPASNKAFVANDARVQEA